MNMKGGILLASILTAGGPPTALGAAGTELFTLSKKAFGRGTSFGTTDQPDSRLRRVFRQCVGNVDLSIALADFPQFSPCLTSVSMATRDFLFLFSQPLRPTRRAQSSNLIPVLRPPQGVDRCPEQVIQDSPFGFHPAIVPPEQYGLHTPYDAAVDIGVRWERNYAFYWWTIQPDITKEEFKWGLQDEFVLSLPSSMRLMSNIYIMDRGDIEKLPGTYLQYAKSMKSFLPRDEEAYKRFVRAVVERYDGDGNHDVPGLRNPIRHWQIDNEPQIALSFGWSGYAELLRMGYDAIKEADPEAKVVMGGATGWPPASSYLKYFDRDFLPILEDLAKDRRKYFDILDFHWYGNATGDYLGAKEVYAYIRKRLDLLRLAPPDEYWISEMGTYSGDPDRPAPSPEHDVIPLPYQSEAQQASDLIKRLVYPLSFGIKKVFPAFGLKEGFGRTNGYFDYTGLIYDGSLNNDLGAGIKKLSYYAYKKTTEILEGCDWSSIRTVRDKSGIHVYKLEKGSKSIWVAWDDNHDAMRSDDSHRGRAIVVSGIASTHVRITEGVPRYEKGKDVLDYDSAFNAETRPVRRGTITLVLGDKPVFVEEK